MIRDPFPGSADGFFGSNLRARSALDGMALDGLALDGLGVDGMALDSGGAPRRVSDFRGVGGAAEPRNSEGEGGGARPGGWADGQVVVPAPAGRGMQAPADRVVPAERAAEIAAAAQRDGARVVLTNGCFDLIHRGHVEYLAAARELGDLLIVGLNSDETVRRLKGDGRPINPAADRAAVLAALRCVDYVVEFAEETASELVATVRPDVYVKGGDYSEASVPEAAIARRLGAEVRMLGLVEGRSTTAMLTRAINHS
jgi:rfaE bifunctional protein nucleotidyltransferase chain/domain